MECARSAALHARYTTAHFSPEAVAGQSRAPTAAKGPACSAAYDACGVVLPCRSASFADVVLGRIKEIEAAVASNANLTKKWKQNAGGFGWPQGRRQLSDDLSDAYTLPTPGHRASEYRQDDLGTAAMYEPYRTRARLPPLPVYRHGETADEEGTEEDDIEEGFEALTFSGAGIAAD
jgi:hypothetical protein